MVRISPNPPACWWELWCILFFNFDGFQWLRMNLPQTPKRFTIGVQRFKSYVFIKAYRNSISLCLHCTVLKNHILLSASSFQDPMKESSEINWKNLPDSSLVEHTCQSSTNTQEWGLWPVCKSRFNKQSPQERETLKILRESIWRRGTWLSSHSESMLDFGVAGAWTWILGLVAGPGQAEWVERVNTVSLMLSLSFRPQMPCFVH